jgi:hypothetical protein
VRNEECKKCETLLITHSLYLTFLISYIPYYLSITSLISCIFYFSYYLYFLPSPMSDLKYGLLVLEFVPAF